MGINASQTPSTAPVMPAQVLAGQLGIFGSGQFNVFHESGMFKVPPGVTKIRVRVLGGGGAGYVSSGYTPAPGGTTSFGSLISASGGAAGFVGTTFPAGGVGNGGDFQASGGTSRLYGGGGAGSQLGTGGTAYDRGGAGVGNGHSRGSAGGSAYGIARAFVPGPAADGSNSAFLAGIYMRFPFDVFTGAGGTTSADGNTGANGGVGGGAAAGQGDSSGNGANSRNGGIGGGGAASFWNGSWYPGNGGLGAGGAAAGSNGDAKGGAGGGYAHGVFDVVEGTNYMVTVSDRARNMSGAAELLQGYGGAGICIVEF